MERGRGGVGGNGCTSEKAEEKEGNISLFNTDEYFGLVLGLLYVFFFYRFFGNAAKSWTSCVMI